MSSKPGTPLGEKRALELLRRSDHRIVLMHTPEGQAYYVVPGGRISSRDAVKIIGRPDVHAFDDGLFPNAPQSWKLGGRS
jgi:hypothetical protein